MRKLGLPWIVICVAVLGLALAGCSGKDGARGPAGIAGTNGTNGTNGNDGTNGADGTATCMQCHTDNGGATDSLLARERQFGESQHAKGATGADLRRGTPCSGCHTDEGYQVYAAGGTPPAVSMSSRIGCFTCHAPHTRGNFTLRKDSPTLLNQPPNGSYNKGPSNTCAMCHQARNPSPDFATGALNSSRWGPHHATQANVLSGAGAYVFAGGSAYPNSAHNSLPTGCVTCHMGALAADNLAGGHTFNVTYLSGTTKRLNSIHCTGCHEEWKTPASPGPDVNGMAAVVAKQAAFKVKMDEVKALLVAKGWVIDSSGLVNATTTAPLDLQPADKGAIWNWLLLDADRSGCVHNPKYANAVIDATKLYLQGKSL